MSDIIIRICPCVSLPLLPRDEHWQVTCVYRRPPQGYHRRVREGQHPGPVRVRVGEPAAVLLDARAGQSGGTTVYW